MVFIKVWVRVRVRVRVGAAEDLVLPHRLRDELGMNLDHLHRLLGLGVERLHLV